MTRFFLAVARVFVNPVEAASGQFKLGLGVAQQAYDQLDAIDIAPQDQLAILAFFNEEFTLSAVCQAQLELG